MFDRRCILGLVALGCIGVSDAQGAGAVRLGWDTCTSTIGNKDLAPGSIVRFFATVSGQSESHTGYQLRFTVGPSSGGAFPDAWRFDPAGCQGSGRVFIDYLIPTAGKSCPPFSKTAQTLAIRDYSYDPGTGKARIVFALAYPSGVTSDPAVRSMLVSVAFEHSFSEEVGVLGETCGGVGTSMCIATTLAEWADLDIAVFPFAIEQGTLTVNDATGAVCAGMTPALPATWGRVKDQYRR